MRRYRSGRKSTSREIKIFAVICALLSASVLTAFGINRTLRPIAFDLAQSYGSAAVLKVINDTVSDYFDSADIGYSDLVRLKYTSGGFVSSVEYNSAAINKMKSDCLSLLSKSFSRLRASKIKVPLGDMFDDISLSGRGPTVTVKISESAVPDIEVLSTFEGVGVNQSRNEIIMRVSALVSVYIPPKSAEFTVSQDYVLAQTVIVGDVPSGCALVE